MDHQLQTFVFVAEHKNFTRAAEALHITQSAVTLAIKSLEKHYQVKLLDRTNKYVRLTKAGEILYHHAKEILSRYERVERLIADLSSSASGPLMIGSSYTFGEYLLPKIISEFNDVYPAIEPNITISNTKGIIAQLLRGQFDIGIVEGEIDHPQLIIRPFSQDELVVVVSSSHPLASMNEVDIDELSSETWILREEGSGTRQAINLFFSKLGFSPAKVRSFGSSQIIKESVEAGLGISILSEFIIRKEMLLDTIRPLRIRNCPLKRNFSYAIHKSEFQPKSTDLFLQFLQAYDISCS